MSKKKTEILEEISRLSNADISNFMIDTTSFGDLISNIKTTPSQIKTQNFSKSKNRTSFNFDFTKGTMITTLFNENDIINEEDDYEEDNNNNNNKKKKEKKKKKELNLKIFNLQIYLMILLFMIMKIMIKVFMKKIIFMMTLVMKVIMKNLIYQENIKLIKIMI